MPPHLIQLCTQAAELKDIPSELRQHIALTHLAAAGAFADHPLPIAGDREEHVRQLAGTICAFQQDDRVLADTSTGPLIALLWALADDQPVERLLAATVVGLEVGGRLGFGRIGHRHTGFDLRPSAAAAAAGAAWWLGRSGPDIATAVSLAMAAAGEWSAAQEAADPKERGILAAVAALRALSGSQGPGALDMPERFSTGLGKVWLSRSLCIQRYAVRGELAVALEGVNEILQRHQKAADKRLRADQVERVEIALGLGALQAVREGEGLRGPGQIPLSLAQAIGVLVAQHRLDASVLSPQALAEKQADIDHVASTVVVHHSWQASLQAVGKHWQQLPVVGGGPGSTVKKAQQAIKEGGWPPIEALWKGRPDRALRALWGRPANLEAVDPGIFEWTEPVEIKLYTTRGGWWPERRQQPAGVGAGVETEALRRFINGKPERAAAAEQLRQARGSAAAWVQELCR